MFVQTQDLFTPFKCIIVIETQKMSQGQLTLNVTSIRVGFQAVHVFKRHL